MALPTPTREGLWRLTVQTEPTTIPTPVHPGTPNGPTSSLSVTPCTSNVVPPLAPAAAPGHPRTGPQALPTGNADQCPQAGECGHGEGGAERPGMGPQDEGGGPGRTGPMPGAGSSAALTLPDSSPPPLTLRSHSAWKVVGGRPAPTATRHPPPWVRSSSISLSSHAKGSSTVQCQMPSITDRPILHPGSFFLTGQKKKVCICESHKLEVRTHVNPTSVCAALLCLGVRPGLVWPIYALMVLPAVSPCPEGPEGVGTCAWGVNGCSTRTVWLFVQRWARGNGCWHPRPDPTASVGKAIPCARGGSAWARERTEGFTPWQTQAHADARTSQSGLDAAIQVMRVTRGSSFRVLSAGPSAKPPPQKKDPPLY